jgi:integrative and conjugative element protein (TIGR02256 family)
MRELAFATEDRRSIILIEPVVVEYLSRYRQVETRSTEAGGVLLGHLRGPHFHILTATDPGPIDRRSRTSFHRQDESHKHRFLQARQYDPLFSYLGDWHTHPEDTPTRSWLDQSEWKLIGKSVRRSCVFLIQGRLTISCYFGQPGGENSLLSRL